MDIVLFSNNLTILFTSNVLFEHGKDIEHRYSELLFNKINDSEEWGSLDFNVNFRTEGTRVDDPYQYCEDRFLNNKDINYHNMDTFYNKQFKHLL